MYPRNSGTNSIIHFLRQLTAQRNTVFRGVITHKMKQPLQQLWKEALDCLIRRPNNKQTIKTDPNPLSPIFFPFPFPNYKVDKVLIDRNLGCSLGSPREVYTKPTSLNPNNLGSAIWTMILNVYTWSNTWIILLQSFLSTTTLSSSSSNFMSFLSHLFTSFLVFPSIFYLVQYKFSPPF